MNYFFRNRHFILGPLIIGLAFTLAKDWMVVMQLIGGLVYIGIGILRRYP